MLEPTIDQYFVKATVKRALTTRHPYDFIETYQVLQELFGYRSYYVNLGFWKNGSETVEPGRHLAFELADYLSLSSGDNLLDVGAGLGQAAIDLCRRHNLARVAGLNKNKKQVAFANALATHAGLSDKVYHFVGDASKDLGQFVGKGFKALMAMECIGHFRDPEAFLKTANSVLAPGGRIAISLNIAADRPSLQQRILLYAAFGSKLESVGVWCARLERAGYRQIEACDITDFVLRPGLAKALEIARHQKTGLNPLIKRYTTIQLSTAYQSVLAGALKYYAISAKTII